MTSLGGELVGGEVVLVASWLVAKHPGGEMTRYRWAYGLSYKVKCF